MPIARMRDRVIKGWKIQHGRGPVLPGYPAAKKKEVDKKSKKAVLKKSDWIGKLKLKVSPTRAVLPVAKRRNQYIDEILAEGK